MRGVRVPHDVYGDAPRGGAHAGSGGYGMLVGPQSTAREREAYAARMRAHPHNFISQPVLPLSRAACFVDGSLQPDRTHGAPAPLPAVGTGGHACRRGGVGLAGRLPDAGPVGAGCAGGRRRGRGFPDRRRLYTGRKPRQRRHQPGFADLLLADGARERKAAPSPASAPCVDLPQPGLSVASRLRIPRGVAGRAGAAGLRGHRPFAHAGGGGARDHAAGRRTRPIRRPERVTHGWSAGSPIWDGSVWIRRTTAQATNVMFAWRSVATMQMCRRHGAYTGDGRSPC